MSAEKRNWQKNCDPVVRCYSVGEPTLHPNGFTIYKVTEQLIQVDALEKATEEIVVWKRFNDFKKLYKSTSALHAALHRREQFPEFAKSQLFNRFEPSVIVDRMRSAQDLLNFIGQRHYLVNCNAFKQFFQDAEKVSPNLSSSHKWDDRLIPPMKVTSPISGLPGSSDGQVRAAEEENGRQEGLSPPRGTSRATTPDSLRDDRSRGGDSEEGQLDDTSWLHHQVHDETSSDGGLDDDDNDDSSPISATVDLLPNAQQPVPDLDLTAFDPLLVTTTNSIDQLSGLSNEWLLSSVDSSIADVPASNTDGNFSARHESDLNRKSSKASEYAADIANILDGSQHEELMAGKAQNEADASTLSPMRSRTGSLLQSGKGDLTESLFEKTDSCSPVTQLSHSSIHGNRISSSGNHVALSRMSLSGLELDSIDSTNVFEAGYVVDAARLIGQALQLELAGEYWVAFAQYKCAIAMLLRGVQSDTDPARRDAVRKKTARYLVKAEELYRAHIAVVEGTKDGESESACNNIWQRSHSTELDSSLALLRGATSELSRYKVIGVLHGVLLVMDTNTEGTYVIKVLHKSCSLASQRTPSSSSASSTIVPTHIPYVVSLVRFFETDNAIFLLLQHAAGGTLWNYVGAHLAAAAGDRPPSYVLANEEAPLASCETTLNEVECSSIDEDRECELNLCTTSHELSLTSSVRRHSDVPGYTRGTSISSDTFLDDSGCAVVTRSSGCNSPCTLSPADRAVGGGFKEHLGHFKPNLQCFSIESIDSAGGSIPGSPVVLSDRSTQQLSQPVKSTFDLLPSSNGRSRSIDAGVIDHCNSSCKDETLQCKPHATYIPDEPSIYDTFACGKRNSGVVEDSSSTEDDCPLVSSNAELVKSSSQHAVHSTDLGQISGVNLTDVASVFAQNQQDGAIEKNCDLKSGGAFIDNQCQTIIDDVRSATASKNRLQQDGRASLSSLRRSATENSARVRQRSATDSKTTTNYNTSIAVGTKIKGGAVTKHGAGRTGVISRGRNRTLSSTFGELDLACDSGDTQGGVVTEKRTACLPESCVRQWAAEVIVAVGRLHVLGITCRDLRPANLLLGDRGHILLTYFSEWSSVDRIIDCSAIENLYCAPEIGSVFDVTPACDWWSLGALLFELLTGKNLRAFHPAGITQHTQIEIPNYLSAEAQSLLSELLRYNPAERLGGGAGETDDIRSHPFFASIEWNNLIG